MPVFVHLTSHRSLPSIRRSGIACRGPRWRPAGVHAMPVTRNVDVAHQWLREMKRWGRGVMLGVYFRLPDEEPVEAGHYNTPHVSMTAAQAVAVIIDAERRNPRSARQRDRDSAAVREG